MRWREHHVSGGARDWDAFFAGMVHDAPVEPLVRLLSLLADDVAVIILSGRPADYQAVVERWLEGHGVRHDAVLLRPIGDRRPDWVVKRELFEREVAPRWDVVAVVDDRPKVIAMWRDLGLYVLTAADPGLDPLTPG